MRIPPLPSLGRDRLTAVATGAAVVVALGGSGVATAYDRSGTFGFANTLVIAAPSGRSPLSARSSRSRFRVTVSAALLSTAAILGAGEALTKAGVRSMVTAPGEDTGQQAAYTASHS